MSHHTKGAPTRYAISEAEDLQVIAFQRYDSYPDENYKK